MENVFIGFAIALLAFLVWRLRVSSTTVPVKKETFVLPPNVTLRPQPLLTDAELLLYNLIRLAVEDHYLVFARVPLWSVVSVEAEGKARIAGVETDRAKATRLCVGSPRNEGCGAGCVA